MKDALMIIKHVLLGAHNIPKILFGNGRLTDAKMRKDILAGTVPPLVTVDADLCLGCSVCSHICPAKAITMKELPKKIQLTETRVKEKIPEIDHMKCVYCFQCHDTCPVFTLHKKPAAIHPRGVKTTGIKAEDLFPKK
ncbi:4Fe-4S dicluster domain-containing protein [Candidatus Altiarchaeota archaeon]